MKLDGIINTFTHCIIHVINYNYQDLRSTSVPIILEHYIFDAQYAYHTGGVLINTTRGLSFPRWPNKYPHFMNLKCVVHVLLFPPNPLELRQFTIESFTYTSALGDFFPKLENFLFPFGVDSGNALASTEIYGIIATNQSMFVGHWAERFAKAYKRMAFNIIFVHVVTEITEDETRFYKHLLCRVCQKFAYTAVYIRNEDYNSLQRLREKFKELGRMRAEIPWIIHNHRALTKEYGIVNEWYSKSCLNFRALKHNYNINIMLFQTVVENASIWRDPLSDPNYARYHRVAPLFRYNDDEGSFMETDFQTFQFLTCDGLRRDGDDAFVSFWGFVSAFDSSTWVCILSLGFLTVVVQQSAIKWKYNGEGDAVFNVVGILLEQGEGSNLTGRYGDQKAFVWIAVVWVNMGVILSNAYKGDNITELVAPRKSELITTYQELFDRNFSIYNKPNIYVDDFYKNGGDYIDSVDLAQQPRLQRNGWDTDFALKFHLDFRTSPLFKPIKSLTAEQLVKFFSNSSLLIKGGTNALINIKRLIDQLSVPRSFPKLTVFQAILSCNRTAFGEWSNEINTAEVLLKILKPEKHVSRSALSEGLWYRRSGFNLRNWVDPRIPWRLKLLTDSGILNKWKEFQEITTRSWYRKLLKSSNSTESEGIVKALEMNDNVSSVFYILLVGILVDITYFMGEYFFRGKNSDDRKKPGKEPKLSRLWHWKFGKGLKNPFLNNPSVKINVISNKLTI